MKYIGTFIFCFVMVVINIIELALMKKVSADKRRLVINCIGTTSGLIAMLLAVYLFHHPEAEAWLF